MDLTFFQNKTSKNQIKQSSNLEIDIKDIQNSIKKENIDYFLPWFVKYQLKNFEDLTITQETKKILDFIKQEKNDKALFLYGQAGSGKTTTVHLMAKHFDYELFEMNASDTRSKSSIQEVLKSAINQKSFFSKKKLFLIDEVDGISGYYDRGGVLEIINIIKQTNAKIILAANDIDLNKIKPLKKVCKMVNFENSLKSVLEKTAQKILTSEKVKFDENDLKKFIEDRNSKDIRGFINDLQSNTIDKKFEPILGEDLRDYKKKIDEILLDIFYSYPDKSLENQYGNDIDKDDLILFIEENIPRILEKQDLFLAFDNLSKADLFRGRIFKWQYYRYLVYIYFYASYGISSSKQNPKKVSSFDQNKRILKKWIYSNMIIGLKPRTKIQKSKDMKKSLIENLADRYRVSVSKFQKEILPFFCFNYKNNQNFRIKINQEFDVDEKVKLQIINLFK